MMSIGGECLKKPCHFSGFAHLNDQGIFFLNSKLKCKTDVDALCQLFQSLYVAYSL